MVDPRGYRAGTRAALALFSHGHCYFPGCKVPTFVFVDGEPIINYQIAHIRDAKPGNRYVKEMTDDERRDFRNLVLLCTPHHTEVDNVHPEKYSIGTLEGWKAERESGAVAQLRGLDGLTEDRLGEMIREALGARPSAARVDLDWSLDEESFEDVVADVLRLGDDITLRRFLQRCLSAWRSAIEFKGGSVGEALQILDRLTCLAAFAIRWDRNEWASKVLETFESMYGTFLSEHGAIRLDLIEPGHRLLMAIIDRVLALGTVAVDEKVWNLIPELVVRRPAGLPDTYTNWVRHATTSASRAEGGRLSYTDSASGRTVQAAYLELTLLAVAPLRCVNPDAPNLDAFRSRLAGFDALATLAVWHHAPGDRDHPYFPWHRAYEGYHYEPTIAQLINDDALRGAVFPGTDEALAKLLLDLEQFSIPQMSMYGGGWRYTDPTILAFVSVERERQRRAALLEEVLLHAKQIGRHLPMSRRGRNPTLVTYSNGAVNEFVGDLETYKRLVENGVIDYQTARVGPPPKLVTAWTADELQAWLDAK
jgi:hypothetical protein